MISGRIRLEKRAAAPAEVTVALSTALRIGDHHALETLESVRQQDIAVMDLVIVDDASPGGASGWVLRWVRQHRSRFNRVVFAVHETPLGHEGAMRTALDLAETEFVLELDSNHALFPRCVTKCLERIRDTGADRVRPLVAATENGDSGLARRLAGGTPSLWRARFWRDAGGGAAGWGGPPIARTLEGRDWVPVEIPEILAAWRRPADGRS